MLWQKNDTYWYTGHLDIFLKYRVKCPKNPSCFKFVIQRLHSLVREQLECGHLVCYKSPAMTHYTISNNLVPSIEQLLNDYYVIKILDDGNLDMEIYTYKEREREKDFPCLSGTYSGVRWLEWTGQFIFHWRHKDTSQPHNFILTSEMWVEVRYAVSRPGHGKPPIWLLTFSLYFLFASWMQKILQKTLRS